ncbi:intercellular adhesion molecule 1 isoform X2 [Kryptolebias marmoratus]|nr:intercellular adhesion molecule 1 isoform X2 [Kryptolebias marmoratus]
MGLEKSVGKVSQNGTTFFWTVESLTEWGSEPMCFYNMKTGGQCFTTLPLILYQPPQSVSMSVVNHTGPMTECSEYTLQCIVGNIAPAEHLTVTFYRGSTPLGHRTSNSTTKEPVTETFTLSYRTRRQDDGAQFWCEAKLELGPEGPQRPPVVKSEKLTAVVLYRPELLVSENPDTIQVTEGNPLYLNCSAEGNPAPSYTWALPYSGSCHNGSVFTVQSVGFEHEGTYNCTVSNTVGTVWKTFNVDVKVNPNVYIIAAAVAVTVAVLVGAILIYIFYYKPNRMGNYSLKDVFRLRSQHTAVPVRD